jgi:outer membrane protein TolC
MNNAVKPGFALTLLAAIALPGAAAAQPGPPPPRTDSTAAQPNSPAPPLNQGAIQQNSQAAPAIPAAPAPPPPAVSRPRGASRDLTEAEVIALALRSNPDLEVAQLSEKQAAYAVQSEEAAYPFVLQANAGYTHTASPSLGRDSSVVVGTRDTIAAGSALLKDFPTGTQVSLSVQGERTTTHRPSSATIAGEQSGTGYSVASRLSVTQPLLRGAWSRVGELGLRSARLEREARTGARERVASEVVRDSLLGYWELWYASRSLDIEIAARDFAAAQRAEAEARRATGALSPVDVLAFDTRLASLKEEVTVSELNELQRSLELAQLLGIEAPGAPFHATGSPSPPATPSQSEVEAKLLRQSPELKELEARVAVADARADVAGDPYRPRLDLEGYVELRGLGNASAAQALGQVGTFKAVSGYVGVFFETPLTGKRESAEVSAAQLESRIAKSQLDAAKARIRIAASRLIAQLDAAKARLAAAQQTAEIAERLLGAERSRFTIGTSTPLQVQEAEDAVRRARLRVARATVDQVQAAIAIDHAVGDLSARLAASGPKSRP